MVNESTAGQTEVKLAAFESLMTEVSTALADVVDCLQSGRIDASEVSNTLVEMLGVMQDFKPQDLGAIADAIAKLKINVSAPQVTVKNNIEVKPTPIENIIHVAPASVQIMDRSLMTDYEMQVQYDGQGRIETARLVAVPRKASA